MAAAPRRPGGAPPLAAALCRCLLACALLLSAVRAQEPANAAAPAGEETPQEVLARAAAVSTIVPVNSSAGLYQALQQGVNEDVVALLEGDVDLNDPIWDNAAPVTLPPGRTFVIRAPLDRVPNITQPDAIRAAGGKTLNFSQRADVVHVDPGATFVLDGVYAAGIPSGNAYRERTGRNDPYPFGLALYPAIMFSADSQSANNYSEIQYNSIDCSPTALQAVAFRGGIALGNPNAAGVVGDSIYLQGLSTFYFPIIDPANNNATVGNVLVLTNTTVRRCRLDSSLRGAADVDDNGGTPDWVWALVALGSLAAVLLGAAAGWFIYRRRTRARRAPLPAAGLQHDDSERFSSGDAAVKTPPAPALTIIDMQTDAAALIQLRDAWRTRIGQVHGLKFLEPVGRGGFGTVFRGRWKGAIVGIKLVEHSLSGALTRQIQREAALSTSVSHPNIVLTYKVCTVGLADLEKLPHYVEVSGGASKAPSLEGSGSGQQRRGAGVGSAGEVQLASRAQGQPSGGGSSYAAAAAVDATNNHEAEASRQAQNSAAGGSREEERGSSAAASSDLVATLIVMEFCDLGSVHEALCSRAYRLQDGGKDAVAVVRTLIDCAMGLDYLHTAAGIVHGDLKPANMLLKGAGNTRRGWVAKLGDFGVARMLDVQQTARPSLIAGTHNYTAPETMTSGQLIQASDTYAFGIMMWELWTERQPFKDVPPGQLAYRVDVLKERPPLDPGMLQEYASLVIKCWAPDPAARPSLELVLVELRELLSTLVQADAQVEAKNQRFLGVLRETAQHRLMS